jgi:predicted ATPase
MNKIGFKNFRRFKELKGIEFSGVTFLVGRNNSGKSTLVKAQILISNYLKSTDIHKFHFEKSILEEANIVTFGRALCRNSSTKEIFFSYNIENYSVEISMGGDPESTFGIVRTVKITDTEEQIEYSYDMLANTIVISRLQGDFNPTNREKVESNLQSLLTRIEEIQTTLSTTILKKTSREYIELNSELEDLNDKYKLLSEAQEFTQPSIQFSISDDFVSGCSFEEIVHDAIRKANASYDNEFKKAQEGDAVSKVFEELRALKEYNPNNFTGTFEYFSDLISSLRVEYLPASTIKQSALFAIRDRNNALAQAIHEIYQLKLLAGENEHRFIEKWMKEFEIGDSFKINMFAGEAYECKILSHQLEINLSDKGMGSVQAMLLILRIGAIIRKKKLSEDESGLFCRTTIVVEEPELNLHPALQSKLTDMFLEANQSYGLEFIVETHSEYILRRAQLLVAKYEYAIPPNENPFCVYYFNKEIEKQPYEMEFMEDGAFKSNFGKGFFDEASASTLELIKLRRLNKN